MAILNPQQVWYGIQNRLPDYIKSDPVYSQLTVFLNLYYEWLQTSGMPLEVISDTPSNLDIDETIDTFVGYFAEQYLDNFPLLYDPLESDPTIKAHKREQLKNLVKHANDLYISKGTDDSIKMLFRVLFGVEITLFFPKTVIFKPSDGHWQTPITIKIAVISGSISAIDFTYGSVSAVESIDGTTNTLTGASATIETIVAKGNYNELFITQNTLNGVTKSYAARSGISAAFSPGNKVIITSGATVVVGTIFPVPSTFTIADTFGSHLVGDSVFVGNAGGTIDTNIKLSIKSVDLTGKIKKINVIDSASDIAAGYTFLYDLLNRQIGTVTIGGLTYYPGLYEPVNGVNLGFLSDQLKIRGPLSIKSLPNGITPQEYYQEFSYVIKSPISLKFWKSTVLGLLHPSGYQLFGDVALNPVSASGFDLLGMFHFNRDTVNDLDIYGAAKYHEILVTPYTTLLVQAWISQPANILGPTLESLNKFMMVSPAYAGGNTYYGATIPASTAAFSGTLDVPAWGASNIGSTQIKDFANLTVGNFYNGLSRTFRSNIMPQPFIIVTP